jgi:hypothetical protein
MSNERTHNRTITDLHAKSEDILRDFADILEKHGISGLAIDTIGLLTKGSSAPQCPPGKTAKFRCEQKPDGKIVCGWVCE